MKLVENARDAWKWFSMHAMVAAGALLATWELLPQDLKAGLSESQTRRVAVGLLALGVIGRLVKQDSK
jgi:hypothetical protein